jgi:hypothetical protein
VFPAPIARNYLAILIHSCLEQQRESIFLTASPLIQYSYEHRTPNTTAFTYIKPLPLATLVSSVFSWTPRKTTEIATMGDAPPSNDPTSSATRQQILPVPTYTIPYWRTELHPIDSYRSSESLPTQCDIAIIGAGMAGVTTAYHLCKQMKGREPSIVMLEAREVCSGATGRNGVSPTCTRQP